MAHQLLLGLVGGTIHDTGMCAELHSAVSREGIGRLSELRESWDVSTDAHLSQGAPSSLPHTAFPSFSNED